MARDNTKETDRDGEIPKGEVAAKSLPGFPAVAGGKRKKSDIVPSDPLGRYLAAVRAIPQITAEEERQLALRVSRDNDSDAAVRLVTAHLRVVVSIAFEFRSQFQNMLDLIQEGTIGLMKAVERFDPFRGVRLPTYAAYWIRAYILKYILDNWRLVRVGTTNVRRRLLYNLNKVTEKLKAAGMEPTVKLLAEHLDASEADVEDVRKSLAARDVSLDMPVSGDSERTYAEVIGDTEPVYDDVLGEEQIKELLKKEVGVFSKGLKASDRTILFERLMNDEPMKLAEIGDKYGITREAVRQAEGRLLKKLEKYLVDKIPGISDFQFVSQRGRRPVK
ncbi:MAG: sigma-70 family RNA polymerase sigma factor [Nitrospinota bacterium]